jgi:hypothetical protein
MNALTGKIRENNKIIVAALSRKRGSINKQVKLYEISECGYLTLP